MSFFVQFSTPLVLLLAAWIFHYHRQRRRMRGHSLPPGPKPWPLIGNLIDLASGEPWDKFHEWANAFGDIVYIEAIGSPMIVVSSSEIAFDLLEKRSAIYSDRPTSSMDEILGWRWNMAFMPYGQRWRDARRCFHQYFNQLATPNFRDTEVAEVRNLLVCVSEAGGEVSAPQIRHMLARIIGDVVFGMPIKGLDDDYIQVVETAVRVLNETKRPGAYWVDLLPFAKYVPAWVPGAKAKQLGVKYRPLAERARNQGFDFTKSNKNSKDCVALDLITRLASSETGGSWLQEAAARDATGIAYAAAVDTTLSLLSYFFAAMAMHPDVQVKAQAELDAVIGPDRLPNFDHFDALPYIRAILLECARWMPVTPLAIPHMATREDYYKGYFIPKGTVVWPNVKRMLHNPEDYPEPHRFDPDRFMKDGSLDPDVRDPLALLFGFGRRICVGRHFAKDIAFITIATVLHQYTVHPSVDAQGRPLDCTPVGGLITYPKRLACSLVSRSGILETTLTSA